MEELKSGISHLAQRPPQIGQALRSLGVCCHEFLRENNADGFYWSLTFLQSFLLRRMSFVITSDSTNKLFSYLQTSCFDVGKIVEFESPVALAAFFTGSKAMHDASELELSVDWFEQSYNAARSKLLKYEIAVKLYKVFSIQGNHDDALQWIEQATEFAQFWDTVTLTRFKIGMVLASVGKFDSAAQQFDAHPSNNSVFALALRIMLDAEVKFFQGSFESRELVVEYEKARRLVIGSCMTNLVTKLQEFTGPECFSQEFLLTFLELDGFSKYFIREFDAQLVKFGGEETTTGLKLSSLFFAYDIYWHGRERIIELQYNQTHEVFMDPRPHFEKVLEKYWNNEIDINSAILCQQISLKAGQKHWTCFDNSMEMLSLFSDKLQAEKVVDILSENFRIQCSDGEDPCAWAYYCSSGAALIPSHATVQICKENLEKCLERARTPTLLSMAALNLGAATDDTFKKLELLEMSNSYALDTENVDLIIQSSFHLFDDLCARRDYGKMHQLSQQLSDTLQSFPTSLGLGALVKWMHGTMQGYIDTYEFQGLGYGLIQEALDITEALELVDPLTVMHRYLTGDGDCSELSSIQNYYMRHVSAASRQQMNYYRRTHEQQLEMEDYHTDSLMMFYHFRSLVLQSRLEEAEVACSHLLQNHHLPHTLIQLVKLCAHYYQRDYSKCRNIDVENSVAEIMESVITAALALGGQNSPYFEFEAHWYHSEGLEALGWRTQSIEKMEESLKAFARDDANFGFFSDGRIQYVDRYYPRFQKLQLALIEVEDADKSLLWSERQRTRDFMYSLRRQDREGYLKELAEFNEDDDLGLELIAQGFRKAGAEAAIIVINQYKASGGWIFLTFFVHPGKNDNKLLAYHQRMPENHFIFVATVEEIIKQAITDPKFSYYFQTLHELLIEPFKSELETIKPKKIILVPSKEMFTIPFNFLLNKHTGRFLIQDYAITTVSSLRLLGQCELRRMVLEKTINITKLDEQSSLVVGNPTKDLDFASLEAHTIARLLSDKTRCSVNVLHNQRATKQAVLQQLPSSDWIHIACHGVVDPDEFPEGALLLASNNADNLVNVHDQVQQQESESSTINLHQRVVGALLAAKESEKLLGNEIVQHCREMKACAAILAACSTGIGRKSAEGILALPRSFHICGVPSVVVSLWEVGDDTNTGKLMDLFYERLLAGKEIAEALQSAIVEMLDEEDEVFGGPAYAVISWAPFIVSGSCSTRLPFQSR